MEYFDRIDDNKHSDVKNGKELATSSRRRTSKKYYKIVLVGNYGVGKSCIVNRIMNRGFDGDSVTTLGASFNVYKRIFNKKGDYYSLHVWDTAGQERFKSITRMYYRNSDIILIIYDLNDLTTLENIANYWVDDIISNGNFWHNETILVYLVGNKSDLYFTKAREDPTLEQKRLELIDSICRAFPLCKDFRVSARNNEGIDILLKNIYTELDSRLSDDEKINGIKKKECSGGSGDNNSVDVTDRVKWYRKWFCW